MNKEKEYQKIRWTNIVMLWVWVITYTLIIELTHDNTTPGGSPIVPVLITFWICRWWMRNEYIKDKLFKNKIWRTVKTWLIVIGIKLTFGTIMNIIFLSMLYSQ